MEADRNESIAKTKTVRKEYQSPQLLVYGGIRDLTKAVGARGLLDGGGGGQNKTSMIIA